MITKRSLYSKTHEPDHVPEPEFLTGRQAGNKLCVTIELTNPRYFGKSIMAELIKETLDRIDGIKIHDHNDPR